MNKSDKLEMMDLAMKSIQKAKVNIEQNEDLFIVELFKSWGYIKGIVESVKEEKGQEPLEEVLK